jgi:uncharacterized membrane protein
VSTLEDLTRRVEESKSLDDAVAKARQLTEPLVKGRARELLGGKWLGHAVHPMLTDLPIGLWTSAMVVDVLGGKAGRPAAQRLIGLGVAAVPATALTGWSDWRAADDTWVQRAGVVHAAANTLAAVAFWRSWSARRRGAHGRGLLWSFSGAALATVGGYLGGHLAFGSGPDE